MASRPRLKAHARALRRGHGALQVGLSTDTGVVLDGLTEAEIALVERLDGTLDLPALYAAAASSGVDGTRVAALLGTLREHHLLLDAPTDRAVLAGLDEPRRSDLRPDADALAAAYHLPGDGFRHVAARAEQHVVIGGEGSLPRVLAALLLAGGIGRVGAGAHAVDTLDLGLRRHRGTGPPDLVVLTAATALESRAGEPWRRRGIPHLPLVSHGHRVVVGPLVTGRGPCLHCLDLHRSDRDPGWPGLLAQLLPATPVEDDTPVSAASALTAIAAGLAAMVIHTALDGLPVQPGLSAEVGLPWPQVEHRRWSRHPLCGCTGEQERMGG